VINSVATWSEDPVVDVLLVASDGSLAEMYRMKLEMDGYRVTTVRNLNDWTLPSGGWRPDIVMVDLSRGDLGRLLDVQGFRSDHFSNDVPLLILSTQSEGELRARLPLSPTDYVLHVSEPGYLSQVIEH
jgi:DNA-binding response OmpR family regulator